MKSIPRLKAIFDTYYSDKPKKFIEIFIENKECTIEEIVKLFEEKTAVKGEIKAIDILSKAQLIKPISSVIVTSRANIANYTQLINGGIR